MIETINVVVEIIFLLAVMAALIFYLVMLIVGWRRPPFVPSSPHATAQMIMLADIKPGEILFDLGSGDGRVLIAAARAGANAQGWELNPILVWLTRLKVKCYGLQKQVSVHCGDYLTAPLGKADVIMTYLLPQPMRDLKAKLIKEARPGTRVVSNAFVIDGWTPAKQAGKVMLYVVP